MTKTLWTPGPWSIAHSTKWPECFEIGTGPWRDPGYFDEWQVATVWGGSNHTTATAHLIAAAPDLYGALEALHRQALQSTVSDPANEYGREALDAARAALAKARGETE